MENSIEYSGIDFKKYFRSIFKHWYWFLISIPMALVGGYIINKLSVKEYAVNCSIVLGDETGLSNYEFIDGGYNFNQLNPINKEIEIIRSKHLVEQTISQLNFRISYFEVIKRNWIKRARYGNVPFLVEELNDNPANIDALVKLLKNDQYELEIESNKWKLNYGDTLNTEGFALRLLENRYMNKEDFIGNEYIFKFNRKYELVHKFRQNLSVSSNPGSKNILNITVKGESPEQLILFLNTLCNNYIENDKAIRSRMATNTIKYIDSQLYILTQQLKDAENKLILYRRKENIFSNEVADKYISELMGVQNKVQEIDVNINGLHQVQSMIKNWENNESTILPLLLFENNNVINENINGINELIVTREYLLKNQKSNSPDVLRVNQQIEIQVSLLLSIIDKNVISLINKKSSLEENIKDLEKKMIDLPASERQLGKLQRDFELAESIFNIYQQKRIEAVLAKASTISNIRVLDRATVQTLRKVKPTSERNIKIAMAIAILLPLGLIILKEQVTHAIASEKEIKRVKHLSIIGKLTHNRTKTYLVSQLFPSAAVTESFRTLLAKVEYINHGQKKQVIGFTSGSSGEGKTFSAVNLSILMASGGKKTLLIGLDLRKPQLHNIFQVDNKDGMSTYLSGKNSYQEVIYDTQFKNLKITPSGPIPPNPVELVQNPLMEEFVNKAKMEFDYILIDTPPVGIVADALLINRCVDLNLFVIRIGFTRRNVINFIDELQGNNSLTNLKIVINDIKVPERYGYSASSKYGVYYGDKEKKGTLKIFGKELFK
ncbi:MAG: polysaccharide biosynthesis tyrosine autokinase [Bacteroidales bacterium]|nr:polysaccharide biosynthesis tyrosine autokinase [Bacteroidales bacterium]